jgi:hypothetical protein
MRCRLAVAQLLLALWSSFTLAAQQAPKVVSLAPAAQDCAVDARTTAKLVVTFDVPMSQTSWSFCGGGPSFPKTKGKPAWKNGKTIELEVELEPDHEYSLSLNCSSASGFRSAAGAVLAPVPWSFVTLPLKLPDQAQQKVRNEKALRTLMQALDEHYSYRDLRVQDWKKLEKEHAPALLAAKTDKVWACLASHMLEPTQDLHLCLRIGESTFATGSRAVDPLYRRKLLDRYLKVQDTGTDALYGRTDDGIGYLMVGGWHNLDMAAIERALGELRLTRAIVVDARPNAGGDETLAQKVAAWFVDGTRVYGKNRYRTGKGRDAFGPVLDRSVLGNADPQQRCDKPVAVLTSRYVMSSNESFVMMMKQAKDCTTVGQPTYGSSGNPKPFDLGNGVTALVPSWQDLRPDGTCFEGQGLAPDVLVEADAQQLEQKDPILEKALEVLRAKAAGKQ